MKTATATKQSAKQPTEVESSQATLANTDHALASLYGRIQDAQRQITEHKAGIGEIEAKLASGLERCSELEQQIRDQEDALRRAKTAASLAHGTQGTLEKETAAQEQVILNELTRLREALMNARNEYAAGEHGMLKTKSELLAAILGLEAQISTLEAEQTELEAIRETVHAALGRAIFNEVTEQVTTLKEKLAQAEQAVLDCGMELLDAQASIKSRLENWPDMQQEAQTRHGRKFERKKIIVEIILEQYISYLKLLSDAHRLASTVARSSRSITNTNPRSVSGLHLSLLSRRISFLILSRCLILSLLNFLGEVLK